MSAFYRCTKSKFLDTLLDDWTFISEDGPLLHMTHGEFQRINEKAWIGLVTALYYRKFFLSCILLALSATTLTQVNAFCSQSSGTPKHLKWLQFIRRVYYHVPKVTKVHEFKLIPSLQPLILHSQRANYILKLLLSVPLFVSPFLNCYEQFGWQNVDGRVDIIWGDIHSTDE